MLVKQISNLFQLANFFVRAKRPLSVNDIVAELSWPRSSVFNIISTMVEHGYLYQPVARGGYCPTAKWMDLARGLSECQPLPVSVHELLVELMNQTGETMLLAAPAGDSVVYLDVVESSADLRYIASVGQRLPMHVTAAGRAILSQYSASERAATLRRIKYQRFEKATFMTAESVEQDLKKSANDGWYVNLGNYAPGVAGIAVPFPFRDLRNSVVLCAPISRVEDRVSSIGKLLRKSVSKFLTLNRD
jgi:IclR family transcriptional regulator, acetate operon repressor